MCEFGNKPIFNSFILFVFLAGVKWIYVKDRSLPGNFLKNLQNGILSVKKRGSPNYSFLQVDSRFAPANNFDIIIEEA